MMQWLNANLDMYGIKLKRVNTRTDQWFIESPWQIVIEPLGVKVRHQDETQILPEAYKLAFNDVFIDQLMQHMDNDMYVPIFKNSLQECIRNDPEYGIMRIGDRVSWNYHLQKAKHDGNHLLINRFAYVKHNEDEIIHFELARQDNPRLTWNIFKERSNFKTTIVGEQER